MLLVVNFYITVFFFVLLLSFWLDMFWPLKCAISREFAVRPFLKIKSRRCWQCPFLPVCTYDSTWSILWQRVNVQLCTEDHRNLCWLQSWDRSLGWWQLHPHYSAAKKELFKAAAFYGWEYHRAPTEPGLISLQDHTLPVLQMRCTQVCVWWDILHLFQAEVRTSLKTSCRLITGSV